jgi:DNA polymerase-3 subunit epsilon
VDVPVMRVELDTKLVREQIDRFVREIEDGTNPEYRVLRRLEMTNEYPALIPQERCGVGVYLDTETTGTDPLEDHIVELALVRFNYDVETGAIGGAVYGFSAFEEPPTPIDPEATSVSGITNEMVAGLKIDDATVAQFCGGVSLIVAHNAEFDRKLCERRFPWMSDVSWGCTQYDIPWRSHGIRTGMLQYLVQETTQRFYDGHRAVADCRAGLHMLAEGRLPHGGTPMVPLLAKVQTTTFRVWAVGAPFQTKRQLKQRGYRAYYTPEGTFGCWWLEVPREQVEAELDWCRMVARARPVALPINARDRYSVRVDNMPVKRNSDYLSPYP